MSRPTRHRRATLAAGAALALAALTLAGCGTPAVVNKNSTAGFVMGAGVDLHLGVHIMPEFRYTRWSSAQIVDPSSFLKSNQNQAEFLLGITF